MPHTRNRHIIELIAKKTSFSPVVAIQGARQTGKSFIGRELLPKGQPQLHYLTLDEKPFRLAAQNSPDDFLSRFPDAKPLVIDEVQKSPDLFDAIKLSVDKNRVPGKFIILGSTEFSRLTHIRESLTGRMSRVRVFPFNLSESLSLDPNSSKKFDRLNQRPRIRREELHTYLERGGLPGLFAIRSSLERDQALTDLIDLILFRDARFSKWFDAELGRDILEQIARLSLPNLAEISSILRVDARRIKRHLEVLKELFVIHSLEPHRLGFGKSIFFLYDCALAKFLGASHLRVLQTWLLNEQLSQRTYQGEIHWKMNTYFTQKGSQIDFLIENPSEILAIKILDESKIRKTDILILKKLAEKAPSAPKLRLIVLAPISESYKEDGIEFFPFEAVV